MKCVLLFVTMIAACLILSGNAFADWAFHIANDNMDETWEVFLLTDETLNVGGYSLSFAYDYNASTLDWNGTSYTNTPPDGMNSGFGSPMKDGSGGISNFNGNPIGFPSPAVISGNYQIGSFTLNYRGGRAASIGDFDWFPDQTDFFARVNDYVYSGSDLATDGHLTVMNPVPLLPAVWMLGTGLIGLTGIRRRMRK